MNKIQRNCVVMGQKQKPKMYYERLENNMVLQVYGVFFLCSEMEEIKTCINFRDWRVLVFSRAVNVPSWTEYRHARARLVQNFSSSVWALNRRLSSAQGKKVWARVQLGKYLINSSAQVWFEFKLKPSSWKLKSLNIIFRSSLILSLCKRLVVCNIL